MKWLTAFIVVVQLPFLAIAFLAAGTDGKTSSVLAIQPPVVLVVLVGVYSLFRLFSATRIGWIDVIVAAAACSPTILFLTAALFAALRRLAG